MDAKKITASRAQAIINKAKAIPCADCGESYGYWAMAFDHRPGEVKLFDISDAKRNRTKGHPDQRCNAYGFVITEELLR